MHLPDWAYRIITGHRRCKAVDELGDRCLLHAHHLGWHQGRDQHASVFWLNSGENAE